VFGQDGLKAVIPAAPAGRRRDRVDVEHSSASAGLLFLRMVVAETARNGQPDRSLSACHDEIHDHTADRSLG
jgi:hypothetical protein